MVSVYRPDIWFFSGVALQNDTLRVRSVDGYTAVPPLRGTGFVRSAIPGEMFRGKIHGARVLGLELVLFSYVEDPILIHQNLDILAKVFNTQTQIESDLTQFHPDGTIRTAQAHCSSWNPKSTDDHTGAVYVGVAEFLMSDPYFYAPVASISSAAGAGIAINNVGTVRTHRIVFSFFTAGGFASPTVVNTTNGLSFTLGWGGAGAHTALVDCHAFTATVDATNEIGVLTHSGDLPFMVFEPGVNLLNVSGCDSFRVDYYSAYI